MIKKMKGIPGLLWVSLLLSFMKSVMWWKKMVCGALLQLREAQTQVEELQNQNKHLTTRLDRIKQSRTALGIQWSPALPHTTLLPPKCRKGYLVTPPSPSSHTISPSSLIHASPPPDWPIGRKHIMLLEWKVAQWTGVSEGPEWLWAFGFGLAACVRRGQD